MPSSCIVPVVEVRNIREHPGADTLSIVEVLGYQIVTSLVEDQNGPIVRHFADDRPVGHCETTPDGRPTEIRRFRFRYREGEKAVYFAADTVLPDKWVDEFQIRPYVKSGNRIGRARLRGEPSFGMIAEIPPGESWEVGQNVADYYGATKYEPPADKVSSPDAASYDSDIDTLFQKYSNIENGWLLYEKFLPGEEVVATEKLHGKNVRVGLVNDLVCVGSRTERKDPHKERDRSLFWPVADNPQVDSLLRFVKREMDAKVVIVYGEVFGQGVQSLHYGQKKQKGFRAFDIYVDGDYLNYDRFLACCKVNGVETVPELYRGPFDLAKIKDISNGRSVMPGADHIREGVVVRSVTERRDPALGRVVLKFVSNEYDLSKHKDKDTTDV